MTTSSAAALHAAIIVKLANYGSLTAVLGSNRIFEHTPNPPPYPYLMFGQSTTRSDDSDIAPSDLHTITLQVWSRARGRDEAHTILEQVRAALHDQPLSLDAHRLVNLRHEFSEVRRDSDGITFRGLIRFRALTEAL